MIAHSDTTLQVRQRRAGEWCWLDTATIATYGPRIGAYGVAIYAVLASHASSKTQACWPSINRIAELLKLSRSSVKRTLRTLAAEGLIDTQARKDEDGDPTTNRYTLLDPTPAKPVYPVLVDEGGRVSETPPSVPTDPTVGSQRAAESASPQPEERTTKPMVAVAARGEERPKPRFTPAIDPYDEARQWTKTATLPDMDMASRPDTQLDRLNLASETVVRLYAQAEAHILANGGKRGYIPLGAIQATMVTLYEQEQTACVDVT